MARAPAFQAETPLPNDLQNNDLGEGNPDPQPKPQQCAAEPAATTPQDPDLRQIIDAWPNLPEALKAGIVAMVKAAGGK